MKMLFKMLSGIFVVNILTLGAVGQFIYGNGSQSEIGLDSVSVATGTYPFGSYSGGPDVVNLGNLNVNLAIPIRHKAGRGLNFDYALNFNSSVYGQEYGAWSIVNNVGWQSGGPAGLRGGAIYVTQNTSINCYNDVGMEYPIFTSWGGIVYVDANGVNHSFTGAGVKLNNPSCASGSGGPFTYTGFPAHASDGSGIVLNANTSTVTDATNPNLNLQGVTVTLPGGISGLNNTSLVGVIDKNGNEITSTPNENVWCEYFPDLTATSVTTGFDLNGLCSGTSTYTDTLGEPVLTEGLTTNPSQTTANYPFVEAVSQVKTYSFQNGNGATSEYQLHYSAYQLESAFGCQGIIEAARSQYNNLNGTASSDPVVLPDYLLLPDGRKYTFTYEPTPGKNGYVTGRIASITFPSGGSVSYTYSVAGVGPNDGTNCADGSVMYLTRTVSDANGNVSVWTYVRSGSGSNWQTIVTDPLKNQTVLTFAAVAPSGSTESIFYETNRAEYTGSSTSGTLMRTTSTSYNGTSTVTLPIAMKTVETSLPGTSGISSETSTNYDSFGSLTHQTTYDYGIPGAGIGVELDKFVQYYEAVAGIFETQLEFDKEAWSIANGPNVMIGAQYLLDQVATTPTSGVTQHTTGIGLGNTTSSEKMGYLVQGGGYQAPMNFTYYDTGIVNTVTDVSGAKTTFSYTQCDQGFPTGTSQTVSPSGVTLTTSTSWDCVGGLPTSQTDVNGNTTYIFYNDPFWRTSSTKDALGNTTTYSYPTASSNTSEVVESFNGGASIADVLTTYDGLGRPILVQKRQSPSATTFDSVATQYDLLGRPIWTSLPYSAAAGVYYTPSNSTVPGVTKSYDALGRVLSAVDAGGGSVSYSYNLNDVLVTQGPAASGENTKQRSLEYDAEGRLTSVCEITAASGSGSCGQNTAHNGYLTKYAYNIIGLAKVSQNAQPGASATQTRTISYDYLGRKSTESIPETGTSNFTYDSDSSGVCSGSSIGDLVKSVDAMGNTTCLTYDNLHRPLSSQVVSGGYASVTPITHFVYDAGTLNGTSMTNVKGSMAEAYTCTGSCAAKLTDIFFSSSPNAGGSIAKMWESTPNSGGYFLTQTNSYANGALAALSALKSGASIGLPNLTFGIDGEGRQTIANDTTNKLSLVGSVAYNAAGAPTAVLFGNGDSDGFSYDPKTGRPTQFQYSILADTAATPNIAAFTQTGALTWNPNGSLKTFAFTDGNDATKNQTCSYSLDDLSRLASVSCGGAWAQTFTYDAFGNIQKSGSGSYMAGYNAMTNQVSSGVTAAYDLNGNQTKSTNAWLTWNAAAQPITVTPAIAGATSGIPVTGTYDALGRLVENGVGGVYTQYVYSPDGSKIAVVQNGKLVKGTIPLPGGETAIYNASGLNFIRHKDWLGSSRLATTWAHGVYAKEAYAPFGESYNEAGTPDRSFTGQDQDTVPGVYDFLFRKYDPAAGRWLSPDPSGWGAVSQSYPQSLNRYAYVQNNPNSQIDANGLDCIYTDPDTGSYLGYEAGDCDNSNDTIANEGTYVDGTVTNIYTTSGDANGLVVGYTDTDDSGNSNTVAAGIFSNQDISVTVNGDTGTATYSGFYVISGGNIYSESSYAPNNLAVSLPHVSVRIAVTTYKLVGPSGNQFLFQQACPGSTRATCGAQNLLGNDPSAWAEEFQLYIITGGQGGQCVPVAIVQYNNGAPYPCT